MLYKVLKNLELFYKKMKNVLFCSEFFYLDNNKKLLM
jgi:hypothetical protein